MYEIETKSIKHSKTLELPDEISTAKPTSLCFTYDSSGIVCRCQFPDLYVISFYFDKKGTVIWNRICRLEKNQPEIDCIVVCNPNDSLVHAVGSEFVLRYNFLS